MRMIIVARYSGQQKSPVISSDDPLPAPPPVERPNPWPRTPVSAIALPAATCAPFVGVRPRASSGACFTAGADVAFVDFALASGIVISGVFAAGGRIASRLAGS